MRTTDLHAVLNIVSDLGQHPADPAARRAYYLTAVSTLLGSACALFCAVDYSAGNGYQMSQPTLHGFDDSHQALLADYFHHRLEVDPCGYPMKDLPGAFPVASRVRLLDGGNWYNTDHFNLTRRPMGLDEGLYSRIRTADTTFGICFMREARAKPFARREHELLSLLNQHASKLLELEAPRSPIESLAPRYRAVAQRLLAGDSSKQAALALGLSRHTVIQYTKTLHRHFNVSSRAELLLKLLGR